MPLRKQWRACTREVAGSSPVGRAVSWERCKGKQPRRAVFFSLTPLRYPALCWKSRRCDVDCSYAPPHKASTAIAIPVITSAHIMFASVNPRNGTATTQRPSSALTHCCHICDLMVNARKTTSNTTPHRLLAAATVRCCCVRISMEQADGMGVNTCGWA